jgi:hypothetical protein
LLEFWENIKGENYIAQYQIKKIPNFWEFEKNLVPPPHAISGILRERVGNDVGRRVGND